MSKKLRLLVVDDSILFRKVLIDKLSEHPGIEVVGYAIDAFDAQEKIKQLNPDVVTMDVEMPKMTGIEFLKKLMPSHPVPVVLVSSLNIGVFDALSAGAVDFVKKPDMQHQNNIASFIQDLTTKIFIASTAKLRKPAMATTIPTSNAAISTTFLKNIRLNSTIIALGASTGGTEATLTVLKNLPENTPGILVVQHMPPGFTAMYAQRLNKLCKMEVAEAKTGDKVVPGKVLIAPGDAHMKLVRMGSEYTVRCQAGEKVSGHCPSVDVLFRSVAEIMGDKSIGILLTGMGRDGAEGLLQMKNKGAYTIGQNQESCVVYGMPMEAKKLGAVRIEAHCDNIANVLMTKLNKL